MLPLNTVPPQHPLALPAGFCLEEYRIMQVLGQGGFGITYLAEDTRMNVEVAIKELMPTDFVTRGAASTVVPLTQSTEEDFSWAKQRFIDEARILVRLNHSNIVRVFRFFELNGTAYLVQEFVRGQSLKEWMQTHPQPTEEHLKALLLPLLDGLQYVHEEGLLHRDVSPENIMVTDRGRPVLLDFGSARAVLGTNRKLTSVVRHGFSPIEQYQSVSPQGPSTDLYALAGVMIQAISGTPPPQATDRFGGRDPYQPLITRFHDRYPKPFLMALDAAFAAESQNRPQTVAEWRRLLAAEPGPVPTPKAPPLAVRRPPPPGPQPARVETSLVSEDPCSRWIRKSLVELLKNVVVSGTILVLIVIVIVLANAKSNLVFNPAIYPAIFAGAMESLPAALGLTLLFLARKVDLSIMAIGGLTGAIFVKGTQWGWGPAVSLLVSLASGLICGFINGAIVGYFNSRKIAPSLIVTSLTLVVYSNITRLLRGDFINGVHIGEFYEEFSRDAEKVSSMFLAIAPWIVGIFLLVTQVALIFTPCGKLLFSLGSPSAGSPRSFWKCWLATVSIFSLSGLLGAISGAFLAAKDGIVTAGIWYATSSMVVTYAVVALGGGNLLRSRATPVGTALGVLSLCFLGAVEDITEADWHMWVAIMLFAAAIDPVRHLIAKRRVSIATQRDKIIVD